MTRGSFITLEGGEGAGKSTQARLLAEALRSTGIEVFQTREPGGTKGAEAIRAMLLDRRGTQWNAQAEALLFAAARSDHVEQAILPALEAGQWVVCDRFIDSSRAYQGGPGGLRDEDLLELHRIGSGGTMPDLTLLIEIAPAEAAQRLADRDGGEADRIGGKGEDYHEGVAQAFDRMAAAEPGRFRRIDGGGEAGQVHERIMQAIAPLLDQSA